MPEAFISNKRRTMAIFGKDKKIKKEESREEIVPATQRKTEIISRPDFLLRQSWNTEKAGRLAIDNKYFFIVDRKANKSEVKKAVEQRYGAKVEKVNIINIKGKAKRLGRTLGRTSALKKAVVTLGKGEKIEGLV